MDPTNGCAHCGEQFLSNNKSFKRTKLNSKLPNCDLTYFSLLSNTFGSVFSGDFICYACKSLLIKVVNGDNATAELRKRTISPGSSPQQRKFPKFNTRQRKMTGESKIAFVVSPLRSLMKNLSSSLNARGIKAACILPANEMQLEVREGILNGEYQVMFCSPESLICEPWSSMLRSRVYRRKLCLVALDEAHCISEWGETFRPAYKEVSILKSIVQVPFLVLTATATETLMKDVLSCLELDHDTVKTVAVIPDRPNIFLKVVNQRPLKIEVLRWVVDQLIEDVSSPKTIIYCRTIGAASDIYEFLVSHLLPVKRDYMVEMYHSALHRDDESRVLSVFPAANSNIRVLVSTVAFGMGVSIMDIRQIIHWGVSKSILSYWQEVGRAGRDGQPSTAYVYATSSSLQERFGTTEEMVDVFQKSMRDGNCLRKVILSHLSLKQMDMCDISALSSRVHCSQACHLCTCNFCSCCSNCLSKCPCRT